MVEAASLLWLERRGVLDWEPAVCVLAREWEPSSERQGLLLMLPLLLPLLPLLLLIVVWPLPWLGWLVPVPAEPKESARVGVEVRREGKKKCE